MGAQKDKINLGVALYGRGFKIDSNQKQGPYVSAQGGLDVGTSEKNFFDYNDLKSNYLTNENYFFDEVANSPYMFDTKRNMYISFDD